MTLKSHDCLIPKGAYFLGLLIIQEVKITRFTMEPDIIPFFRFREKMNGILSMPVLIIQMESKWVRLQDTTVKSVSIRWNSMKTVLSKPRNQHMKVFYRLAWKSNDTTSIWSLECINVETQNFASLDIKRLILKQNHSVS